LKHALNITLSCALHTFEVTLGYAQSHCKPLKP
jgi:hypothetical protein